MYPELKFPIYGIAPRVKPKRMSGRRDGLRINSIQNDMSNDLFGIIGTNYGLWTEFLEQILAENKST